MIGFVTSFCFGWYGFFASFFIFYAFLFIVYAKQVSHITKYLGDILKNWAIKREIIQGDKKLNISLSIFGVIIVCVAVYLTNNYVINFDEIKSKVANFTQSIKSSQSKQTQPTQQKQTQPAKSAKQPTTNMIRCDDSSLLETIIKSHKNRLINGYNDDIDGFAKWQEYYRKHGINLTSAEEFINSIKYNIINVRTKSSYEVNRQIYCEAEIERIYPIPQSKSSKYYNVIDYNAQLTDNNGIEFEILDIRKSN